ncbi:2'-5' RNA ligase family protein [Nocardia mexicana]|uniref:2'-5' RNA ligase superfamily protein n=1 Tax=Nocardia mexicana TaxID=279262 RepID=A0A370H0Z1_9NOCA|nr:2'-5' RNA ligase family protein [Nocardia mexicana]RDI49699.1 2'-5' RNA ligase superfamily protein [Nocardia mexicana]
MVQSVELLLDDAAEAEVRRQWRLLAEVGVHSPAADRRPHITVGVAREIWPRLDRALAAEEFHPLPVRLGGLVIFGARSPVLVRLVVPTAELLDLQRRLFSVIAQCPGIPANVRPDAWTPHVTLARRVKPQQFAEAVPAVAGDRDFPATVVGIRRWDGDHRREWPVARGSGR